MKNLITIAVDAMGGDGSPQKIVKVSMNIIKKIKTYFIIFLEIKMKFKNSYQRI